MRKHLDAAFAGSGGLVLIGGEAGIGKTMLAEVVAQEAHARGATVAIGHCYDLAEMPPYGPWQELFTALPALANTLPLDDHPLSAEQPHGIGGQLALFTRIRDGLMSIAAEHPLVLILDDLQWADTASLDLLRVLGRQLGPLPILLLVAYRDDDLTGHDPLYRLLPTLVREAQAERLELRRLDAAAVRTLVISSYDLPEADTTRLTRFLHERTEGNPFFLKEVLRLLEEEQILREASDGWLLGPLTQVRVPTLLRQIIDGRLARLSDTVRELLAVAAVIGQEPSLLVWAAVANATEATLLLVIERATEARLLAARAESGGVRFAHALIREALYESLSPPQCWAWHARTAETLATGPMPDPDTVAYHFQRAGDQRAAVWLIRAGDRAQHAYAWLAAAARFEAALVLLKRDETDAGTLGWLLFRIAVLRRFSDPHRGIVYLEEAERLAGAVADHALAAYALFHRGLLHCLDGAFQRGLSELTAGVAALDALPATDHARLAVLERIGDPLDAENGRGELALWLSETGHYVEGRALGERLLVGPLDRATAGSRGDAAYGLGFSYAALGQPEDARRALGQAREAFSLIDHRAMILSTLFFEWLLVVLPYRADRPLERQRLVVAITQEHERLALDADWIPTRNYVAPLFLLEGRWAEVRELLLAPDPGWNRLLFASLLGPLARNQGDPDLAWRQVYACFPAGPDTKPGDVACYTIELQRVAAALALDVGDLVSAREWLEAHDRWLAWSGSVLGLADRDLGWAAYQRALGDEATTHMHARSALAHATSPRQPLALLAAHRLLGELATAEGRLTEAETQLEAALALAEACGAAHERALTLLTLADLRRAEGDLPTAQTLIDAARAICGPLGAAPALAQATHLAARLAATQPMSAPSSTHRPAGNLSPREVEVLRLVAAGLTNREVADRLCLSPRTVGQHLFSIYNKLGISSRAAATRFAVEQNLV